MSYVAWSHSCATPAAVPSCAGFYGLLSKLPYLQLFVSTCTSFYKKKLRTMFSKSSVLATLCVHMHVLLREATSFHVSGCCETSPGLGRVAFQLACPTCHTTCLPLCGVFATHEHPFKHARTQRKTHCTTATPTRLQCKKMLCMFPFRFSPALSPGSPGRRNDPDREWDGSGRHRDTGERPPPSDGVRQ